MLAFECDPLAVNGLKGAPNPIRGAHEIGVVWIRFLESAGIPRKNATELLDVCVQTLDRLEIDLRRREPAVENFRAAKRNRSVGRFFPTRLAVTPPLKHGAGLIKQELDALGGHKCP